jgi:hypothetical protein
MLQVSDSASRQTSDFTEAGVSLALRLMVPLLQYPILGNETGGIKGLNSRLTDIVKRIGPLIQAAARQSAEDFFALHDRCTVGQICITKTGISNNPTNVSTDAVTIAVHAGNREDWRSENVLVTMSKGPNILSVKELAPAEVIREINGDRVLTAGNVVHHRTFSFE